MQLLPQLQDFKVQRQFEESLRENALVWGVDLVLFASLWSQVAMPGGINTPKDDKLSVVRKNAILSLGLKLT